MSHMVLLLKIKNLGILELFQIFHFIMLIICQLLKVGWYVQTIKKYMKLLECSEPMACLEK